MYKGLEVGAWCSKATYLCIFKKWGSFPKQFTVAVLRSPDLVLLLSSCSPSPRVQVGRAGEPYVRLALLVGFLSRCQRGSV